METANENTARVFTIDARTAMVTVSAGTLLQTWQLQTKCWFFIPSNIYIKAVLM